MGRRINLAPYLPDPDAKSYGQRPYKKMRGKYKFIREPGSDVVEVIEPDGSSYVLEFFETQSYLMRVLGLSEVVSNKLLDWVWGFSTVYVDLFNDHMWIDREGENLRSLISETLSEMMKERMRP